MSESAKIAIITAVLNGAITWGIVTTKMDWMRADIAKLEQRIDRMEARK